MILKWRLLRVIGFQRRKDDEVPLITRESFITRVDLNKWDYDTMRLNAAELRKGAIIRIEDLHKNPQEVRFISFRLQVKERNHWVLVKEVYKIDRPYETTDDEAG